MDMNHHKFFQYFLIFFLIIGSALVSYDKVFIRKTSPISPMFSGAGPILWPFKTSLLSQENPSTFASLNQPKPFRVPIILYHYVEVVTDERDTLRKSMSVNPVIFENQLKALKEAGYHFALPGDIARAVSGEIDIPAKSISLTFDDGYQDFYTIAYPILKRQSVPAINYIVYNFIGKNVNYMTEAQIKEIVSDGLVVIGSHTLEHPNLTLLTADKAKKELLESKNLLEKRFGIKVYDFAYPGGYNNEAVQKLVKEVGYLTAVATQLGEADENSNLYRLPRVRVGNLNPSETLILLDKKVGEGK